MQSRSATTVIAMSELPLAGDHVDEILAELDLEEPTEERAREIAENADWEWPVNRSPVAVAASAIYLASLLHNDKITQQPLAEAAGCSVVAIRDGYHELAEQMGIPIESQNRDSREHGWRVMEKIKEFGVGCWVK